MRPPTNGRRAIDAYEARHGGELDEPLDAAACRHRKELLRTVRRPACCGRSIGVKVYACELRGECSLIAIAGIQACPCKDYDRAGG